MTRKITAYFSYHYRGAKGVALLTPNRRKRREALARSSGFEQRAFLFSVRQKIKKCQLDELTKKQPERIPLTESIQAVCILKLNFHIFKSR